MTFTLHNTSMSLSSILQHVKKKGQVTPKPQPQPASTTLKVASSSSGVVPAQRPVDPVVARLKEKRRLEREQKEQEAREKKGLPPKKTKPKPAPATAKARPAPSKTPSKAANPGPSQQSRQSKPPVPQKKMSFNDLMKRASKIDQSKLSISFQSKNKSPEAPLAKSSRPSSRASSVPAESRKTKQPASSRPRPPPPPARPTQRSRSVPSEPRHPKESRAPLPIRGPSAMLESKLKTKKPVRGTGSSNGGSFGHRNHEDEEEYDSEDSMDSFIESDDEEEFRRQKSAAEYDRDEIWAIFNKGKKRSYYNDDYDSDDMEATGAEIFEEERRSKRNAELEDRREAEEERRLAELKRKKLNR
ncbi:SPT2-domain-containing protein [Suhomyces tanzawaensis NRRL Y-17324]|uniref:SPT2-domain-containing protein n=1 Tax=Suhomyces tanzawaensis NRRL Y-17324 TaxID=984487 RepID=A0A1E4SMG8_9ASCO|nr:SPT2-domain-containing protein [Suhomyces tanzawaensis NRRL Y-17324]ODV80711.1 SPT2-domain-containing protein [Suhomyces tanzawaensis NRRL Y-17324]